MFSPREAVHLEARIFFVLYGCNLQQADSVLFDPEKGVVKGICFLVKSLFSSSGQNPEHLASN